MEIFFETANSGFEEHAMEQCGTDCRRLRRAYVSKGGITERGGVNITD